MKVLLTIVYKVYHIYIIPLNVLLGVIFGVGILIFAKGDTFHKADIIANTFKNLSNSQLIVYNIVSFLMSSYIYYKIILALIL